LYLVRNSEQDTKQKKLYSEHKRLQQRAQEAETASTKGCESEHKRLQ
jgi:hypothetical protein